NAQVFLRLRKIRMEAQRFFELCYRLRHVALAHENFAKIIMRLRKFRIQCGRLLEMLARFGSLASFKKQIAKVDVSIDVIWIILQRLAIFRDCLFWLSMFFQERAIAVLRLRRLRRQTNSRLTFSCGLVLLADLVQEKRVAGMIFSIARLEPQCLLKMRTCLVELSLRRQQRSEINVRLRRART